MEDVLEKIAEEIYTKSYVVIDNFVDEIFRKALFDEQTDLLEKGKFRKAAVGSGDKKQVIPEIRSDEVLWMDEENLSPLQQEYWNRVAGDKLPAGLDWSVFDWAVNSGVGRSARTLQKIIAVTADGGIGPQTLAAVDEHDTEQLITDMFSRRQAFYERLKTFEHFGKGWTRRNEETLHQAVELCRG
jgi:hypothetical protein